MAHTSVPLPHPRHSILPTMRRTSCACTKTEIRCKSAHDHLTLLFARIHLAWGHRRGGNPPAEVLRNVERIFWRLRREGHELFHVVAMEHPLEGTKRTEISVLLLVPCHDEPTGHRWLAEVLVHQYSQGPKSGMVESVAVRYAADWQDWEVMMDHEYLEEVGKQWVRVHLEDGVWPTGEQVVRGVWGQVTLLLGDGFDGSKREFEKTVSRAVKEINARSEIVSYFEVAKRYRRSGAKVIPTITVLLQSTDDNGVAVIVIDPMGPRSRIKPMAVRYDGEWPIAHQYRKQFPPPELKELEPFVMNEE
ncbi:hypothetical protein JCM24511_05117 [Saitozyma sp. JCM 24511]|nr:hypothetical protein JCM24511_05117 [Saitozyma sp. JCM 24511]